VGFSCADFDTTLLVDKPKRNGNPVLDDGRILRKLMSKPKK